MPVPENSMYMIHQSAAHEIGHFNDRAWLALARLFGLHYPFTESERIDFLMEIKKGYIAGKTNEDTEQ